MKIKCPTKINLFLEILNKRDDNYHNVLLLNQTIKLFDELIIKKNKDKKLIIKCNDANVPTNYLNSVYKTCEIFYKTYDIPYQGLTIFIKKRIPLESGLGGESTDAAGMLKLLYKMFKINDSLDKKIKLAIIIGSDVPFFLYGGRCLITGKGEKIKKLSLKKHEYYVIIKPQINNNTALMFQKLDKIKREYNKKMKPGYNTFEKVCDKNILNIKTDFLLNQASYSMMSGSGSCIFGAFSKKRIAKKVYKSFTNKYDNVFMCKSTFD